MIKRFKKANLWIMALVVSFVVTACGGDTPADASVIQIEPIATETSETTTEDTHTTEPIENVPLADLIGADTLVHNYIMPGSQDMFFEELEPTYDGIERLQITYTVMKEYQDVLAFYQEATGRPEPDYNNAYGYFFDDVFVAEGDDYIEQILVQVLFGKSEVIMILQNTSHPNATTQAAETEPSTSPETGPPTFVVLDEAPEFSATPVAIQPSRLSTGLITVDVTKTGLELWSSAKHKGFPSIEAAYLIKAPFTDDAPKTVWLREDYFAEKVVLDDAQTKFYYYDPMMELYYEASELANAEGGDPILVGTMLYVPAVNLPFALSHNPLVMAPETSIETCYLTDLNGHPALYVVKYNPESLDRMWVKQWISLTYGIVVREEVYLEDENLAQWTQLEDISLEEVPFSTFFPRQDLVYQDRTLFLYFRDNPYGVDFGQGFQATFIPGYFDIELLDEASGNGYTLTFNGDQMATLAEYELTEDMNGNAIEVIRFRDGDAFQVIVPSQETVYLYPSSVYEHQWFQFDTLGFRKRTETDTGIIYTFDKIDSGNVSGMIQRYDYHIDLATQKFDTITTYLHDPYMGNDSEAYNLVTYTVKEPVPSDDSIFQIPETYNTVWIFSHDDGEHIPPWWE